MKKIDVWKGIALAGVLALVPGWAGAVGPGELKLEETTFEEVEALLEANETWHLVDDEPEVADHPGIGALARGEPIMGISEINALIATFDEDGVLQGVRLFMDNRNWSFANELLEDAYGSGVSEISERERMRQNADRMLDRLRDRDAGQPEPETTTTERPRRPTVRTFEHEGFEIQTRPEDRHLFTITYGRPGTTNWFEDAGGSSGQDRSGPGL